MTSPTPRGTSRLLALLVGGWMAISASSARALDFHVDAAIGDDARSAVAAQSATTPWRTIGRALAQVTSGHRIRVQPGTYAESLDTRNANVEVRAEGPPRGVIVEPPPGAIGIDIKHHEFRLSGLVFQGGAHGVRADGADGLVIRDCVAVGQTFNGFTVVATNGATVENSIAVSAGSRGFFVDHSAQVYVRNNLAYANGEWGIDFENSNASDPQPPLSTGNVVAFNTVFGNGGASGGGLRLKNAIGEIRDNVIASNTPVGLRIDRPGASVHHNLLWNNPTPLSPAAYAVGGGMVTRDPLFVDPAGSDGTLGGVAGWSDDSFLLAQSAAGQAATSPAVDAGSGPVATRDISGSTRSDAGSDAGVADLGYHRGAGASMGAPAVASGPATYHVNSATGLDTRTKLEAQSPATPWKTVGRALGSAGAISGDTVLVAAGVYREAVSTTAGAVTLRAVGDASIEPPPASSAIGVNHPSVVIDGFSLRGGVHGVRVTASGAVVRRCRITGQSSNGVYVAGGADALVDDNVVTDVGSRGILIEGASSAYLRNNLVTGSGDWGIHVDGGPPPVAASAGHTIAFNTVVGSGRLVGATGGIRLQNATGEIRDNIVASTASIGIKTDTAPALVHHNVVRGQAKPFDFKAGQEAAVWANDNRDPLFNAPASGDYTLRQKAAGQDQDSPALDRGSGSPAARDISGSTRSDGEEDDGTADIGRHEGASPARGAPPAAVPPGSGGHRLLYVDAASGDDLRTVFEAVDPATPWRSLGRALHPLAGAEAGDTVVVEPGIYAGAAQTGRGGIRIHGSGEAVIAPPGGAIGLAVEHPNVTVEGLHFIGGLHGLRAEAAHGLVVRDCVISGQERNGIMIVETDAPVLDGNRVADVGGQGIVLRRSTTAYVRNNLVTSSGEWGIAVDNGDTPLPPSIDGNVVAFNTVVGNGRLANATGGIRFHNATGEIRDNVVAANARFGIKTDRTPTWVHHNAVIGSAIAFDTKVGQEPVLWSNLEADPLFVDAAGGNFELRQTAAGEDVTSPAVDAGSGPVGATDISGSTRTDRVEDGGVADLGFHAGALAAAGPPAPAPTPTPVAPPTPTPTPSPTPAPGQGTWHFVDCEMGDDARTRLQARDPATPWRTIRRAVNGVGFGDVVVVAPGVCHETVEMDRRGVTVRAATPLGTKVVAPKDRVGFLIQRDDVTVEGFVIHSDLEGVLAARSDSSEVLRNLVLRGLMIRASKQRRLRTNGIQVRDAEGVTIENSIVRGARQQGILLKRVQRALVRNNAVRFARRDWGISLDNTSTGPLPPLSTGNLVAFNTVVKSRSGIRLVNAAGEIRDNIAAFNKRTGIKFDQPDAGTLVHHNDSFGHVRDYDGPSGFDLWPSNLSVDPGFVDPPTKEMPLAQKAAGQGDESPLIDAGSGPIGEIDVSGSTRSDGVPDSGRADPGFHAGAAGTAGPPGGPLPTPTPATTTLHVDCSSGDDTRTRWEASSPWRPLRSIAAALRLAVGTDTVIVAPGTCHESVTVDTAGITLRASDAFATTIAAPSGSVGAQIRANGVVVVGFVVQSDKEGVLVAAKNGSATLDQVRLRHLRVEPPPGGTIANNGIRLARTQRARVEGCTVTGAAAQGIVLKRAGNAYVRSNLVVGSGEWGIHVDNGDTPLPPSTSGNVVAFNTVVGNGRSDATTGGIRLQNATGEVRDNIVSGNTGAGVKTDTIPTHVHHNLLHANGVAVDTKAGQEPALWSNLSVDPRFVDPGGGDFRLRQRAAGQSDDSPAVDAGSGTGAAVDISGSTRTDGVADAGIADLGFHAGIGASSGTPPVATPTPSPAPTPTPSPTPTPTPTLAPTPTPAPGSGATLFVDPATGDDGRDASSARIRTTPWKTLRRAMIAASPGDVVTLLPGTYAESVDLHRHGLTVRGEGAPGDVVLTPPAGSPGLYVNGFENVRLENLLVYGGAQGVVAVGAPGLRVRAVTVVNPSTVGIQVRDTVGAVVDSCVVTGAGTDGVLLKRAGRVYVRNNLVYANRESGITFDSEGVGTSLDNVVAFNTVHGNLDGIRMLNASGEIRDNQLTQQIDLALYLAGPELRVHHNNFSANGRDRDQESEFADSIHVWSSLGANPRYLQQAGSDGVLGGDGWRDDDFRLRQLPGQNPPSPLVDAGSGDVAALDISGSTRSDGVADAGIADPGVHYGAEAAGTPPAPATPPGPIQSTYYVAPAGSDARTPATARRRATPWQTISRALQASTAGDTIVVLPGVYAETAQIQPRHTGLLLLAESAGTAILAPSSGNGITVEGGASGVRLDGFAVRGAVTGVSALAGANGLQVRNFVVVDSGTDGIRAQSLDGITIEDSIVASSASSGLLLRKVTGATVRNVLSYGNGEWGVSLDNGPIGGEVIPVSTQNLIAGTTCSFNGSGGLRLANATGTVRDNLLTDTPGRGLKIDTPGATLLHNGFFAAALPIEPDGYILESCAGCAVNVLRDPRFVAPAGSDGLRGGAGWADDDFRLSQITAGQSLQSEAVDAGSSSATTLGVTGSTATTGAPDDAAVDLGFHYGASSRAPSLP